MEVGCWAAVLLLLEQDPERREAANASANDARVTRLVGSERHDPGLARRVALDLRVLDRDVRVRAPDVDAVGADTGEPEPLEPHVARAVEDGDRDAALLVAAEAAAAVEVRSLIRMFLPFATSNAQ